MPAPQPKARMIIGRLDYDVREDYEELTNMITNSEPNERIIVTNDVGLRMTVRVGSIDVIMQLPEGYVSGPKPT